jgi:type II secretory pathway predicted ATPase ExeA
MSSRRAFTRGRRGILLLGGVTTLAALSIWAIAVWREGHDVAARGARRTASLAAQSVARDLDRLVEGAQLLLAGLALRPEIQARDAARCRVLLQDLLRAFPVYLDILAVAPNGEVFCAGRSPALRNLVNPADVRRSVEQGDATLGQFTPGPAGRPALTLTVPAVNEAGTVKAVVVAVLDLTWLNRALVETLVGEGATLILVERRGMILFHYPEPERWVGEMLAEPLRQAFLGSGEGVAEDTGLDGTPTLFAFGPLLRDVTRAGDATVVVALPKAAMFRDANRLLSVHLAGLGIVAVLLLVTAGLALDLLILRPITILARLTRRLAAGDGLVRPPAAYRHGALRPLARAVERLAWKFEERAHETVLLEKMLAEAGTATTHTTAAAPDRAPTRPESGPPTRGHAAATPADTGLAPRGPATAPWALPAPAATTSRQVDAEPEAGPTGATPLETYWSLNEAPFGHAADPRFLYLAPSNHDALLQLTYAVRQRRGCALLTGEPGCGKTTLVHALITRLGPKSYQVATLSTPHGTVADLLRDILRGLGIGTQERRRADLLQLLNDALGRNFWRNRDTVIVADDAHLVDDPRWLEQMALLLSHRSGQQSPVTLVLVGSPELVDHVKSQRLLDQRVGVRCHLAPLDEPHTAKYIVHRLALAGRVEPIFTPDAFRHIFEVTGGTPRDINNLCDSALMHGFLARAREIDAATVRKAASGMRLASAGPASEADQRA